MCHSAQHCPSQRPHIFVGSSRLLYTKRAVYLSTCYRYTSTRTFCMIVNDDNLTFCTLVQQHHCDIDITLFNIISIVIIKIALNIF